MLYEELYIHTGHRAHAWRTRITDTLADHHLNSGWVIGSARCAACSACGC
ncbi:hypothetical protein GXW82_42255 [Streptacidiphilus sp. 4-A2]|nr:hypothetical protein [Streptacidiphilus sp. 4-A2]